LKGESAKRKAKTDGGASCQIFPAHEASSETAWSQ